MTYSRFCFLDVITLRDRDERELAHNDLQSTNERKKNLQSYECEDRHKQE